MKKIKVRFERSNGDWK